MAIILILWYKVNENRVQNKRNAFLFSAEAYLNFDFNQSYDKFVASRVFYIRNMRAKEIFLLI